MCVTMIDPATSWFEIMELSVSQLSEHDIPMGKQGRKGSLTPKQKKEPYFDKTSATVGSLINRTWFCHYPETAKETGTSHANYTESMNLMFANRSKENSIYPLTTREIAELQTREAQLQSLTTQDGYSKKLVANIKVLCKDAKLAIPKDLQDRVDAWYHHYLQHLESTQFEETLCSAMYWKGM